MSKIHFCLPKPAPSDDKPDMQFCVYNISKSKNVGNIIRSLVAFGGSTMILIGDRKFSTHGNQDTNQYLRYNYFEKMSEACESLHSRGYEVVGVEIGNNCKNVLDHKTAFPTITTTLDDNTIIQRKKHVCFMFGEEGHGMSEQQKKFCDRFIYIPQYGAGTASLNVSNAAAIVFHEFAQWANYTQQPIDGEKFTVEKSKRINQVSFTDDGKAVLTDDQLELRQHRQEIKRKKMEQKEKEKEQEQQDVNGDNKQDIPENQIME